MSRCSSAWKGLRDTTAASAQAISDHAAKVTIISYHSLHL
jgi:hypothetical protein